MRVKVRGEYIRMRCFAEALIQRFQGYRVGVVEEILTEARARLWLLSRAMQFCHRRELGTLGSDRHSARIALLD